jgi:hypothetical protein
VTVRELIARLQEAEEHELDLPIKVSDYNRLSDKWEEYEATEVDWCNDGVRIL